jgi:hypothetical protein
MRSISPTLFHRSQSPHVSEAPTKTVMPAEPSGGGAPRGTDPIIAGRLRVAANSRLTAMSAIVLSALFCIQTTTVVLGVKSVLTLHVVIGLLLVPPLLVKIRSVSWRFMKYYRGDPAFRKKVTLSRP